MRRLRPMGSVTCPRPHNWDVGRNRFLSWQLDFRACSHNHSESTSKVLSKSGYLRLSGNISIKWIYTQFLALGNRIMTKKERKGLLYFYLIYSCLKYPCPKYQIEWRVLLAELCLSFLKQNISIKQKKKRKKEKFSMPLASFYNCWATTMSPIWSETVQRM